MRTIASQMKDAPRTDRLAADRSDSTPVKGEFGATGTVITFRGFLAAYEEGRDDDRAVEETRSAACRTSPSDAVEGARVLEPQGHETSPPARYTEPTLVRTLEERGIGRPSTYASILGTILDRGYVLKKRNGARPVVPRVPGRRAARAALRAARRLRLHRVDGGRPRPHRGRRRAARRRGSTASTSATAPAGCSSSVAGPRRDRRARDQLARDPGAAIIRARRPLRPVPRARRTARQHPDRARPRRADGREGRGAELASPAETTSSAPTRRAGSRSSRRPAATARTSPRYCPRTRRRSRALPRSSRRCRSTRSPSTTRSGCSRSRGWSASARTGRRSWPGTGGTARTSRRGRSPCSLESEEQLFTIDLPGALALLAQPRQRRGQQRAATKPLRELGTDPVGGKEIVLKEGRFGPYVTDGETNASLRKGDDPETVTLDRAVELLAERRAKGPAKKSGRRRKAS